MAGNPNSLFGKRLLKARRAQHWSLEDLSGRTGINIGHLSRIENGRRPPTERVASAMDDAFETTDFTELYQEMMTWLPPGFRDWPEIEVKSTRLYVWSPGVVDGLFQTPDYARALLSTLPGVTDDAVIGRLARRLERQKRVLYRDIPPSVHVIVDELALYRRVGSAEVMDAQLAHLAEVANLPHVIVQVLPGVAHPATASAFIVADEGVSVEHVLGGGTYTDAAAATALASLFDALRTECYGRTESQVIIGQARKLWIGELLATQARKAGSASRRLRGKA